MRHGNIRPDSLVIRLMTGFFILYLSYEYCWTSCFKKTQSGHPLALVWETIPKFRIDRKSIIFYIYTRFIDFIELLVLFIMSIKYTD